MADLLEKNIEEISQLETLDNGKPLAMAMYDVMGGAEVLRYYAGYTDKIMGNVIPINGPYLAYTRQEPVGVCG